MRILPAIALSAVAALLLAGCSSSSPGTSTTNSNSAANPDPYTPPSGTTALSGDGSSFALPIMQAWALDYHSLAPTVQVTYAGGGSGKGRTDIAAKAVLFAGSDAPLSFAQKATVQAGGSTVLQFPETIGAVCACYNVAGVAEGLKLDAETLGKIYTGGVAKWNDGAIAALNPGVNLPDHAIVTVHRSDSSGTTFVFTDYLSRASPTWSATMGAAATQSPDWTKSTASQQAGNGNDGVGSLVKSTPYSIGYVELAFKQANGLTGAAMKNKDGNAYLLPTSEGAAAAADTLGSSLPAPDGNWSAVTMVNLAGAQAYPISSFTYTFVFEHVSDYGGKVSSDQMQAFKAWMWWNLHDGQAYAIPLGYASLPASVADIGTTALAMIQ